MVCIGTLSPFEAEEDIRIVREILSGESATERELTYSRSKAALKR
jgi:hypothetical protein